MSRPATQPPLPAVDVTVPQWAALRRAQRRADVVRSATGRIATLAGGAAAAAGMFTATFTGASLLATAALSCIGVGALRLWKADGLQRAAATAMYLVPGASLAALLIGERIVPGIHWSEALALATWTVGTWVVRPARIARQLLSPPVVPSADVAPAEPEVVSGHPAARWWAQIAAVEGGTAPDTLLEDVERTGEKSMRAVIRSTIPGRPVPDISVKRLSALMDVPEDLISIGPLPGRGASYRLLTIGQPDDNDPASEWARRIAPAAMPGAVLTGVRIGRPPATPTPEEEA